MKDYILLYEVYKRYKQKVLSATNKPFSFYYKHIHFKLSNINIRMEM